MTRGQCLQYSNIKNKLMSPKYLGQGQQSSHRLESSHQCLQTYPMGNSSLIAGKDFVWAPFRQSAFPLPQPDLSVAIWPLHNFTNTMAVPSPKPTACPTIAAPSSLLHSVPKTQREFPPTLTHIDCDYEYVAVVLPRRHPWISSIEPRSDSTIMSSDPVLGASYAHGSETESPTWKGNQT